MNEKLALFESEKIEILSILKKKDNEIKSLKHDYNELEQSLNEERENMQSRVLNINGKIDSLQIIHNSEKSCLQLVLDDLQQKLDISHEDIDNLNIKMITN